MPTIHTSLDLRAASLEDNASVGTDVNYRSVWARDGAITVIQTLFLDDPVTRAAQRATSSGSWFGVPSR